MLHLGSLRVVLASSLFLVSTAIVNIAVSGCGDCNWVLHGSACYWISSDVDSLLNWNDAKAACERRQATLATVNNDNHGFFIDEMNARGSMHWLGFYKPYRQDTFEYLDGSVEDPYLTFRDGDRTKPSVEKKSEDCAGIAFTDTIDDIWWEDEKCDKGGHYYICVKSPVSITTTTTAAPIDTTTTTTTTTKTTTTTAMMTTTENFTKMVALSIGNYKPRKGQTAPPTSDPVSVISGISAIVILVGVIAFMIGNDIASIFCQKTFCSPKIRQEYETDDIDDEMSHVIAFKLEQEDSTKELDLYIRFKNHYCCAVKPNGKLMKTQKLDAAYLIQNRSNVEVWVRHMAISTRMTTPGLASGGDSLDMEQIIIDHLAKPHPPGKYFRSHSICSSLYHCQPEENVKPVVEGVHTSSPFSVAALIGSGRHDTRTDSSTPTTSATYRSNKGARKRADNKALPGKTLVKLLDPDNKEPIHAAFISSRPSSRSTTHPKRKLKNPPDVISEAPVASYVRSSKTRPKPSVKTTATYLGSSTIKPVKEVSAESGFGDEISS